MDKLLTQHGSAGFPFTVSLIILAAGASSRMKSDNTLPHKLLLPIAGQPMIQRTLSRYADISFAERIVVCGAEIDVIQTLLQTMPVTIVHNERSTEGLATSLACGVQATSELSVGYLIALGDMPFIQPHTIHKLLQSFADARQQQAAPIIAPFYKERRGNPVLFGCFYRSQLLGLQGDAGAQAILRKYAHNIIPLSVDDAGIVRDIDTPEQYYQYASSR